MMTPEEVQSKVLSAVKEHFARTVRPLTPEEIADKTSLEANDVTDALAVLYRDNKIDGIEVAELDYPIQVTGLRREVLTKLVSDVAKADPGNIQEVAATQLALSNAYYKSVLSQAQRSFLAAAISAGVGLVFFLVALVVAIQSSKLDAAAISVIGGAIVEVIAGLNFWLYSKTSSQLDSFHVRLQQTQNYLLANSVGLQLTDEARDASLSGLVKTIAARSVPASNSPLEATSPVETNS
jgi:hypothetical protein